MDGIGSALTAQVRDRVDADEQLGVGAGLLVLAALEGDAALDRALLEEAADPQAPPAAETDSTHTPARRAYLGTISVQGFRGIGAGCDLSINPGPGLTLVVGRNGSGKSSFAEALELLLTGENRRWENRSAVWKAGWRNLHWTGPVAISATLAVEGARQPATVRREWPQGSDLSAGADSAGGVEGDDARAALGWDEAVTTYRPFLPYNELGSIPDRRPADLYDTMSAALGLDALVDARGRLRERRSERDKQVRTAESGRREWYAQVEALDDERARTCAQAINRPRVGSWDLDAVELVLEGAIEPEGESEISLLRGLATLAVPGADEVQAAAARLRTAAKADRASERTDAGRARQIADLLQRSLALHAAHGDRPCPVCGSGELTSAWRSRTEAEVQRLGTEAEAAQRAGQALADARRAARALLSAPPNNLRRAAPPGVDVDALLRAWERWAKIPRRPGRTADRSPGGRAPQSCRRRGYTSRTGRRRTGTPGGSLAPAGRPRCAGGFRRRAKRLVPPGRFPTCRARRSGSIRRRTGSGPSDFVPSRSGPRRFGRRSGRTAAFPSTACRSKARPRGGTSFWTSASTEPMARRSA